MPVNNWTPPEEEEAVEGEEAGPEDDDFSAEDKRKALYHYVLDKLAN